METIIIDTGIIYAIIDRNDSWHKKIKGFLTTFEGRLAIPSPVITEVCYLLYKYLGHSTQVAFINSLISKEFLIEHFNNNDLTRCVDLLNKYKDLNIGFVDACIVAIAERLKVCRILTTDRRHFQVLKPHHCEAFVLLP